MAGAEVQKWADKAMFKAKDINPDEGPQVRLLSCNSDPLGTIASAALMYEGKSVASLSEVTDDQRRYYLAQVQKSILEAPLEFVNFHFIISGVTRGFTHQMVRQRTATYTQESTRFAVKETVPVGLPPSLAGTIPWNDWWNSCAEILYPGENVKDIPGPIDNHIRRGDVNEWAAKQASPQQLWRKEWDECVKDIEATYNGLVSVGMPAEDARGLLPTNLLTSINYNTSLRGLKDHAGVRLCTQAQYEWRQVWVAMLKAIRDYGKSQEYTVQACPGTHTFKSSAWQFDALADIFKPICYKTGKCEFMANVDRHCAIRDRVEAFHNLGIPSAKWGSDHLGTFSERGRETRSVGAIRDEEWMAEGSARVSQ